MTTLLYAVLAVIGGFILLMLGLQVVVRRRARAFEGRPVPELPGSIGKQVKRSGRALLYFFSPGCAACRPITPRVRELSRKNASVMLVDVSQDLATARALKVMATPSVVEIAEGRVVGFHIGVLPPDVAERFA